MTNQDQYEVTESLTGLPVHSGDIVESFRGELAVFVRVTRGPAFNKSAKVEVQWSTSGAHGEYYSNVFGLKVVER